MKIERIWAMPNKWTFKIKPIKKLLREEMTTGTWLDPMSGYHSPAHETNDINPETPAKHHIDALEFLRRQPRESYDGILFDPPYSNKMAQQHYNTGFKNFIHYTTYINEVKIELTNILKPGGKAITFGWNSEGLGKNPYPIPKSKIKAYKGFHGIRAPIFETYRILLVAHGLSKNDTIVTCQRKVQKPLTHYL